MTKDGKPFDAVDFNFWGVTFAKDSNRFYATLRHAAGTTTWSKATSRERDDAGAARRRRVPVALSGRHPDRLQEPDRQREPLAAARSSTWRPCEDHPVAEQRSIDDQVEWLDDDTLVYSDGLDVYTVPADGSGAPRLVLRDATSPVALSSWRVDCAGKAGPRQRKIAGGQAVVP